MEGLLSGLLVETIVSVIHVFSYFISSKADVFLSLPFIRACNLGIS
jgi:hypothetical protein